jgi:hypothetical protein
MTLSQIKQSIIHGLQAYAGGRYDKFINSGIYFE